MAQGSLSEPFDSLSTNDSNTTGPIALTSRGWKFKNQSASTGAYGYTIFSHDINPILPTAHGGPYYLGVTDASAVTVGDALSVWAILPVVPNQSAGDVLTFALFAHLSSSSLEVRYSPNGGVNTGSGANAVGDFTQVLGTFSTAMDSWVQQQVTVPGSGRLAFRYRGQRAAFNGFSDFLGIDTVSVGAAPAACNLPPTPFAGQSVHWTAAGGPYHVCQSITILPGSTVVVDPGAQIVVDADRGISVRGTLRMQGTAAARAVMTAAANFPPMIEVDGGTLETSFADIGGQVRPLANGTLIVTDTTFNGPNGLIYSDLYMGTGFGRFERVTFNNNSELTITNYTLVLRDITLNNSVSRFIRDYPFLNNITADGKSLSVDATPQGTLLDTITVRNVTSAPAGQTGSTGFGLGLNDGNFLLGPDNTLTNNTYPVMIYSAGVLPGSVLPATGNINNLIYVPGRDHFGASTVWSDAGLPYFIATHYAQHGGSLKLLDGAHVKLAANAGMASDPSRITAYGTEERPITFEPAVAGAPWNPLQLFYRIRHAIIDGATTATAWPPNRGWGFMDSSLVRNSTELGAYGSAIIKKTLFQNNAMAASVSFNEVDLNGDTNPNAFEGNAVGVAAAGNARYNWWNSPTGPTSADNPGGTGDSKANGIPFLPFRTVRPNFNDAPPIVDLEQHAQLARPGQRFVLTWRARDDGSIVSQRVILSKDGDIVQGNLQEAPIVLADNLPANQRSFEFVVPEPTSRIFGSSNVRIEAVDDAGQIGWDDLHFYAERDEQGQLVLTSPLASTTLAGADLGAVCWNAQSINNIGGSIDAYLVLENTGDFISLGGVTTYLSCLSGTFTTPFVSTDRARIALSLFTGGGVSQPEYYYGPLFSIRPDARVGDAPPSVTLTSPASGADVNAGASLPITWNAWDDAFVRVVHIQVSTDGGRTWSFIARDLPGSLHEYVWQVPPASAAHSVRIKVIAVDDRFQDSAAESNVTVQPGTLPSVSPGEVSGTSSMTASRGEGTAVVVNFAPACSASNHAVYWGIGPISGQVNWVGSACNLGTTGSAQFDPSIPALGHFAYFVIVGQDGASEGSYGKSSANVERPEASGFGACDVPRVLGGGCTP